MALDIVPPWRSSKKEIHKSQLSQAGPRVLAVMTAVGKIKTKGVLGTPLSGEGRQKKEAKLAGLARRARDHGRMARPGRQQHRLAPCRGRRPCDRS